MGITLFFLKIDGNSPLSNDRLNKLAIGVHKTSAHLIKKTAERLSDPVAEFGFIDFKDSNTCDEVIRGTENIFTFRKLQLSLNS